MKYTPASLDEDFGRLLVAFGRPSTAPDRLIRLLFPIRSERQLMQVRHERLFRWFVGRWTGEPCPG